MRLIDLDPKWLLRDGGRIGFTFKCPNPDRSKWWMTCFAVPTEHGDQHDAFTAAVGDVMNWQPCNETVGWTVTGGIDAASFETMTVMPSIDGGQHMWHGFITKGEIT
jgi:hypothetical protein